MTASLQNRRWILPEAPRAEEGAALARALGVPPALAGVLHARGLGTLDLAAAFLEPPPPPDPLGLPGMVAAVERLARAAARGEGVLVCGDYDCDGVCSAAIATTSLTALGLRVAVHLPRRQEGYGISASTLPALAAAAEARVILTVDNGATAHEAVAAATGAGLDVVITDHHQFDGPPPKALAVCNPRLDPRGPFADLCGAGVAWALVTALGQALGRPIPDVLDLVAVGTIADVVPLIGLNRTLARSGLLALGQPTARPGLRVLLQACGVAAGTAPSARDVAFGLAPRLNAPGRLDDPRPAYDLLVAPDLPQALAALTTIEACNRERQRLAAEVLAGAEEALAASGPDLPAVVLADARWHPGLVGPVAGRLAERLRRPVLLAGIDDQGLCRGSGRGPAGWDLTAALRECRELLRRFGGHAQAAGFECEAGNLETLAAALAQRAPDPGGGPEDWVVDGLVRPADLTSELALALEGLGPFGEGHPEPALVLPGARVQQAVTVGQQGQHLRLRLTAGGMVFEAFGFGLGPWGDGFARGGPLDLVVRPEIDRYRGRQQLRLAVADARPAQGSSWDAFRTATSAAIRRQHPDRNELAAAFRRLRSLARQGPLPPEAEVLRLLAPADQPEAPAAAAMLVIFRELGLIDAAGQVCEPPDGGKVELLRSARFRVAEQARAAVAAPPI